MTATRWLARGDATISRYHRLAGPLLRTGLGVTILLGGAHKLLAPAAWHAYLAGPLAALWPVGLAPLDATFVLFGVSEVLVGLLLVIGWHTPSVALLTALSLLGVVANLAVGVAVGEPHADVLIRDIGLVVLATGVALGAGGDRTGADDS